MRSLGWRPGWDGHLLLFYDEESRRRADVTAWVRRGLDLDAKILYTEAAGGSSGLPGLLEDEPDALEAMERGQIQLVPADTTAYDPAFMRALVDQALSEGYPSVRWSGDAPTAWGVIPRRRHERVEQATDVLCATRPLSAMCQYPTPECKESVGFLSRTHGGGLRDQLFQAAPLEDGLAVAGEVDLTNHEMLRALLVTATGNTDTDLFLLDLSRLTFMDLPGARALLLGTLDHRDGGGRVRLHAPQPQVAHLISLLGIDRADGIDVNGLPW